MDVNKPHQVLGSPGPPWLYRGVHVLPKMVLDICCNVVPDLLDRLAQALGLLILLVIIILVGLVCVAPWIKRIIKAVIIAQ